MCDTTDPDAATCVEQEPTCIAVNQICEANIWGQPVGLPCCAGTVCSRFGIGMRVCLPLTPARTRPN